MNTTIALTKARWRQAHGSAKETWGTISRNNRTRLEGRMELMSGRSQEKLLQTEAQAREQLERAVQLGQQSLQALSASLVSTANQTLGKPAKRSSSRAWIPTLGSIALLAGLSVAMLKYKTGLYAGEDTTMSGVPAFDPRPVTANVSRASQIPSNE